MKTWLGQVLLAIDQLVNALLGGWADESLSSCAWRQFVKGRTFQASLINGLFFWQENHCLSSYESEQKRLQTHPELREWPNQ
jgi:hypothetical protein